MSQKPLYPFQNGVFQEFDDYGCEKHFSSPTMINETLYI